MEFLKTKVAILLGFFGARYLTGLVAGATAFNMFSRGVGIGSIVILVASGFVFWYDFQFIRKPKVTEDTASS